VFCCPSSLIRRGSEEEKEAMKNSATYGMTNIPFSKFKEFKDLLNIIIEKKSVMISSASSYTKKDHFEYVEEYRHLGVVFPGIKTQAAVVVMNHQTTPPAIVFVGENGSKQTVPIKDFTGTPPRFDLSKSNLTFVPIPNTRYYDKSELLQNEITVDGCKPDGGKNYVWRENYKHPKNGTKIILGTGQYGIPYDDPTCFDSGSGDWSKRTWTTIDKSLLNDTDGHLYDKVVFGKIGSNGKLTTVKFIPKGVACSRGVWQIKVNDGEAEGQYIIDYFTSPEFKIYIEGLLTNKPAFGKSEFAKIPHHTEAHKWIKGIEKYDDYINRHN